MCTYRLSVEQEYWTKHSLNVEFLEVLKLCNIQSKRFVHLCPCEFILPLASRAKIIGQRI